MCVSRWSGSGGSPDLPFLRCPAQGPRRRTACTRWYDVSVLTTLHITSPLRSSLPETRLLADGGSMSGSALISCLPTSVRPRSRRAPQITNIIAFVSQQHHRFQHATPGQKITPGQQLMTGSVSLSSVEEERRNPHCQARQCVSWWPSNDRRRQSNDASTQARDGKPSDKLRPCIVVLARCAERTTVLPQLQRSMTSLSAPSMGILVAGRLLVREQKMRGASCASIPTRRVRTRPA